MESTRYRWAEAWLGGYWLLTSMLLIFGPQSSPVTVKLAVLQFGAAIGLYVLSSWVDRHPGAVGLYWISWMPVILWTYGNIDKVQKALGRTPQDAMVGGWERTLWAGASPALEWSQRWPWLLFSEYLHVCYLIYFLLVPILIWRLMRREREDLARLVLCGGVSSLVLCYLINIAVPVLGPRPLLPPLDQVLHGPVWTLCHAALKKGAAGAAAFPSGHTAYTMCAIFMAWHWDRKWFALYSIWGLSVVAATVYGRFHYTVDVLAGVLVALVCAGAVIYSDPDSK